MPKNNETTVAEVEAAPEAMTPVKDAIDTSGGPHFVIDQMCDALERARIEAQARTHDLSVRWGHDDDAEAEEGDEDNVWLKRFWVSFNADEQRGLTVDEAKAALDAIGA